MLENNSVSTPFAGAHVGIFLPESELHKKIRKEILPLLGSRLQDENLIISHGPNSFHFDLGGTSYTVSPDYTFTLPTLKKVPLEILNSIGNKTIWGNVMVPYVLLKYCKEVSHFIFILTGYAANDQYRFMKHMAVTMEMLRGSVDISKKLGIVTTTDSKVDELYEQLKATLALYK